MGSNVRCNFIRLVFIVSCCSFVQSLNNTVSKTLNSFVQDFAFTTLIKHRPRTGALYDAILPWNLSGMDVSVVRLRSRSLWNRGANFSYFHIPPRTMAIPHVRRLAIVYQNSGNWSSHYYSLPGYSLITSVVGFMVFDASNATDRSVRNLNLNTTGQPITIQLPIIKHMGGMHSKARCVLFTGNGTFSLTEMSSAGVCSAKEEGHFSVVMPMEKEKQQQLRDLCMTGFVLVFFVFIGVGYAGLSSVRLLKTKRIQGMQRQAVEELILESRWLGNSKMPCAAVTRTHPVLESTAP